MSATGQRGESPPLSGDDTCGDGSRQSVHSPQIFDVGDEHHENKKEEQDSCSLTKARDGENQTQRVLDTNHQRAAGQRECNEEVSSNDSDGREEGGQSPNENNEKQPPEPSHASRIYFTPKAEDVLLGRGKPRQSHDGNQWMLQLVDHFQGRYHASERIQKHAIVEEVLAQVKAKGGRFLKATGSDEDLTENTWVEVQHSVSYRKVGHAFRSRARRSSKSKQGQQQQQEESSLPFVRETNQTAMTRVPTALQPTIRSLEADRLSMSQFPVLSSAATLGQQGGRTSQHLDAFQRVGSTTTSSRTTTPPSSRRSSLLEGVHDEALAASSAALFGAASLGLRLPPEARPSNDHRAATRSFLPGMIPTAPAPMLPSVFPTGNLASSLSPVNFALLFGPPSVAFDGIRQGGASLTTSLPSVEDEALRRRRLQVQQILLGQEQLPLTAQRRTLDMLLSSSVDTTTTGSAATLLTSQQLQQQQQQQQQQERFRQSADFATLNETLMRAAAVQLGGAQTAETHFTGFDGGRSLFPSPLYQNNDVVSRFLLETAWARRRHEEETKSQRASATNRSHHDGQQEQEKED